MTAAAPPRMSVQPAGIECQHNRRQSLNHQDTGNYPDPDANASLPIIASAQYPAVKLGLGFLPWDQSSLEFGGSIC
jgi:hypothetical protein